jgi:hypothetical protein
MVRRAPWLARHTFGLRRRVDRLSGLEVLRCDEAMPLQQEFETPDPDLIVAGTIVDRRMQRLARPPAFINVPGAQRAGCNDEPERALFPIGVEERFVHFRVDRSEGHVAADIVRPVHGTDAFGRPVPIMESRVTRSASLSFDRPSVPAGRIGTTR